MIQQSHSWRTNYNLETYMYPYVHSSTIYNSQDMEDPNMPIDRWMDEEDVVQLLEVTPSDVLSASWMGIRGDENLHWALIALRQALLLVKSPLFTNSTLSSKQEISGMSWTLPLHTAFIGPCLSLAWKTEIVSWVLGTQRVAREAGTTAWPGSLLEM